MTTPSSYSAPRAPWLDADGWHFDARCRVIEYVDDGTPEASQGRYPPVSVVQAYLDERAAMGRPLRVLGPQGAPFRPDAVGGEGEAILLLPSDGR